MPDNNKWKLWEQKMIQWVKKLCKWQKENPGKDWVQEFGTADSEGPGTNPPPPPPPPPGP